MRLSLKATLASLFALIALVSVGQAFLSIHDFGAIRGNIDDLARNRLPSVDAINRINTATRDNRVKLYRLVVASGTPEALAENRKAVAQARESLARLGTAYRALISSPEEAAAYERYSVLSGRYTGEQEAVMASVDAGRVSEALAHLVRPDMGQIAKDMAKSLEDGIDLNKQAAEASARAGLDSEGAAVRNAYVAMGIAVAASMGAALFSLVGISRPIADMTVAMRTLAEGTPACGSRALAGATRSVPWQRPCRSSRTTWSTRGSWRRRRPLREAERRPSAGRPCATWPTGSSRRSAGSSAA